MKGASVVQPNILSMTIMCPEGVTIHVPAWDGIAIDWDARKLIVLRCPNCTNVHVLPIGGR